MKRLLTVACLACLIACLPSRPPDLPDSPQEPPVTSQPATRRALAVVAVDALSGAPIAHATARATAGADLLGTVSTNTDGYGMFPAVPFGQVTISIEATGYVTGAVSVNVTTETSDPTVRLRREAQPWDTLTHEQLVDWRGFISTVLAPVAFGPRPGRADNVLFSAEYTNPGYDAAARSLQRAAAKAYVHWPLNPLVSKGYHGRYPDADWRGDVSGYLDRVEELYQDGYIPVFFLLPDTGGDACADGESVDWSCVERVYTPIFSAPRFQALARIVVLAWEPNYTAADWQAGVAYMKRVFPRAERGIHMPSNHGAPCRGSELAEAGGTYPNEGACFAPVLPDISLVLQQETFTFTGDDVDPARTPFQQFLYNVWDMGRRMPAHVSLIAFEWGSYTVTDHPDRLAESDAWGAATMDPSKAFQDPKEHVWVDASRYVRGVGDGGRRRR
jgi:hypothetical protein